MQGDDTHEAVAAARRLLCWIGALAAPPALLLLAVGLAAPVSGWGLTGLLALVALAVGLVGGRRGGRMRWVARAASLALVGILALRCAVVRGDGKVRLITLPEASSSTERVVNRAVAERVVNRAVAERDIALSGSRLLELRRVVPGGFVEQLGAAYDRLAAEAGPIPTPLPSTYLGLQRPERFDTLVVEPRTAGRCDRAALIFLHGYAGNVGLICWLAAQPAAALGMRTYCPSVGPRGDWWTRAGARTLAATLEHVRGRGARRIYLAGLSNGASGASVLAPRLGRRLAGLVLISGLSRRAGPPRVPTLLVHGRADPAVPAVAARRYLRRAGRRATHVVTPGDHFVLLTREAQVRAAIGRWLAAREPACAGR